MNVNTTTAENGWLQPYTTRYHVNGDGDGYYAVRYADADGHAREAKIMNREQAIVITAALRSDDDLARHAALVLIGRLDYS